MNWALGHFCAQTGQIGQGESPEDGEMNEKQARYLSVTEAPHNTEFYEWMGTLL